MKNESSSDAVIMPLLARGVMLIRGEVNGDMVHHVYKCLAMLEGRGSPDIEIRIFSSGGSVRAGLDIYDAINRYQGKKVGVVYAYARSMGTVILQACDMRVSMPHASVLIHHINTHTVSLDTLDNPTKLDELRKSMWRDQKELYEILMARTKKTEAEIRAACEKDADMSASEALEFGLIDQIWVKPERKPE